jgi:hypothetical protein
MWSLYFLRSLRLEFLGLPRVFWPSERFSAVEGTDIRVQIRREAAGLWSVTFPPDHRSTAFCELADGLAFAKRACEGGPALIELFSDGIYLGVSQPEGWPQQLCRPSNCQGPVSRIASKLAAFGRWLRPCAHRQSST